jgi:hypothetical protein
LAEDTFGTFKNEAGNAETVRRFTLSNKNGMRVEIINYGATITSLNVPDKTGSLDDVVLGFDNIEGRCLCSQCRVACFILPLLYGVSVFCSNTQCFISTVTSFLFPPSKLAA